MLVGVSHSSLNYKDGLAVTGRGKIVAPLPTCSRRRFCGNSTGFGFRQIHPGEEVLLTGWGWRTPLGWLFPAGAGESDWLVPMPAGLDSKQAMTIGSAGLTAMLCVMTLEDAGIKPGFGTGGVTGAAGGVGKCCGHAAERAGI